MSETQKENISYDRMLKELFGLYSDINIIKFINSIFNEDFPFNSTVEMLETETVKQDILRRSDFMIKINERIFHIEAQTNDDDEMVLRMFEYGYRSALMHNKAVIANRLELSFPAPVVIFLKDVEKTPIEFTVCLKFTNMEPVEYKIPAIKISDYTIETLFKNSLYALAPFYPFKYERILSKNHNEDDEKQFLNEMIFLYKKLNEMKEDEEFNKTFLNISMHGLNLIIQNILLHAKLLNKEEVERTMENTQKKYVLEPLNWLEEAKQEIAKKMKLNDIPLEIIQKCTDLPVEEIKTL